MKRYLLQTDDPEKFKLKEPNFLVPVQVDLQLEREKEENKLVKKTLTIPSFFKHPGKRSWIKFLALLSEAIKTKFRHLIPSHLSNLVCKKPVGSTLTGF
ncbi:hypothetical protein [Lactobacillus helveticus]|jgi:antitoxin HicB|uniref:hypothetical protein n=1 Tax=Lactobacillus helveticus TaxID=1587 RepID=UPI0019F03224|nr:hypothetical protein [Lactobacillus helveticus]NRN97019.1 hypothetical protein [Lactobacillus helveticus]NRO02464.1 hypothetical protein [Lactobacillus helveticus]NRO17980.1 hypothetical protein [Lactobacillus helveticus]NRO78364.1 hypothetical protein [Lactobacillus helveticus]NRO89360.1 hypothetical protein [Lactobacillus helveticus]